MKYLLFSGIIVILACTSADKESNQVNDDEITLLEYPYNDEYSTACNICLCEDTIHRLEQKRAYLLATKGEGVGEIKVAKEHMEKDLEALLAKFEGEEEYEKTYAALKAEESWRGYQTKDVATRACKDEHPLIIKDEKEIDKYLLHYHTYRSFADYPRWDTEEDTSQIKKENGFYMMKIRGESVPVKFEDFPDYWKKVNLAYRNMLNHITLRKNEAVMPLTGKRIQSMSNLELLMFETYRHNYWERQDEMKAILDNDQEYHILIQKFEDAANNR